MRRKQTIGKRLIRKAKTFEKRPIFFNEDNFIPALIKVAKDYGFNVNLKGQEQQVQSFTDDIIVSWEPTSELGTSS
jgi:hypothetical protein